MNRQLIKIMITGFSILLLNSAQASSKLETKVKTAIETTSGTTMELDCESEIDLNLTTTQACLVLPEELKKEAIVEVSVTSSNFESMLLSSDLVENSTEISNSIKNIAKLETDSLNQSLEAQLLKSKSFSFSLLDMDFVQRHHFNTIKFIPGLILSEFDK